MSSHHAPIALVTGATGFVGSRLVRRLVAQGRQVHVVVRPGSRLTELEPCRTAVTIHVHDGTTEGMIRIVSAAKPGVVFHLASLFLAHHEPADVGPLVESNLLFGTQVLEAMASAGASLLINTGTAWQHYENADYSPVCLYAATKQAFEALLQYYVETVPLRALTLELTNTYGLGDPRPKLFRLLARTALSGESLAMSAGEQYLDLVHIDDAVEAFLAAATLLEGLGDTTEGRYAVSSGRPIRLRELVDLYQRVNGLTLKVDWGAQPYRPREVMRPWNRGKPVPGWEPAVSLEEGLRQLGAELRAREVSPGQAKAWTAPAGGQP